MKAKEPKVYTLDQVGKLIGVTGRSVRNYVKAGLIHASPWPTRVLTVTEEELKRIKRDGIDTANITKKLAKRKNTAARTATKKQVKRAGTASRKATKKSR